MKHPDPVDRAFELLRAAHDEPAPDAALEERVRARFRARPRPRWRLPTLFAGGVILSGATFAASGGLEWLEGWWYSVDVDGRVVSATLEGDGERSLSFVSDDGTDGTVTIRRDHTADGARRTRVAIDTSGPSGEESERVEDVFGLRKPVRLPTSELDDGRLLHEMIDDEGIPSAFFAVPDGARGARVLLLREDDHELPVVEIARLPIDLLADSCRIQFIERVDGSLLISARAEGDEESAFEFVWIGGTGPTTGPPPPTELETIDGSVRVRVETSAKNR